MLQDTNDIKIEVETTQTLDSILHQVLNLALVSIDAQAGSLMLVANKRGILQIKARLGPPRIGRMREDVYKIKENSIASWVAQNKKSYLCSDIEKDHFFAPSNSGRNFLSLLSVPVIHQNKVIAVINADAPQKEYFTNAHKEKLEFVAGQVAAPIAERISILDALGEMGVELSRLPSEGGVEPVLEKIAQLAVRSLGADIVTLYQYIQEKDEFPVEGTGPTIYPEVKDPSPMRRKVYQGDVPWTVVKERKSGFYADVEKVDFLTHDVERPGESPRPRFVEREGIKSMAALLLPFRAAELKHEEVVGVMFVNYRTSHEFNIDEISALATFADYAAVAILNARHEQKRRAEQIRIAESISANFAHHMSNLAGTSRVATQVLRKRIDPKDELSMRQLMRIERESDILLELAERIARPFKKTGRVFELIPLDIEKILNEELVRIEIDLGDITIEKDVSINLPKVQSVEFQLHQVFHDIVSNAVEALSGQEKGMLLIRTIYDKKSNRVKVEVSDNGVGIRDDIRNMLFTPGITTKKGKLGIGLWWCRNFMQATGGDIILDDPRLGKGSTFVITIPCISSSNDTPIETPPLKDILIVDDDPEWREQIIDALAPDNFREPEKYDIEVANSYATASNLLYSNRYKLAILDIRLVVSDPENKDGLRLLREMDENDLDTIVLIITGYGTERDREIAIQSPRVQDFSYKSGFDLDKFQALVRRVIQKS